MNSLKLLLFLRFFYYILYLLFVALLLLFVHFILIIFNFFWETFFAARIFRYFREIFQNIRILVPLINNLCIVYVVYFLSVKIMNVLGLIAWVHKNHLIDVHSSQAMCIGFAKINMSLHSITIFATN